MIYPDQEAEYEGYRVINVSSRVKRAKNPDVKKFYPLSPFYIHEDPLQAPLTHYTKPDGTTDQENPWIGYCMENIWQYMKCFVLIDNVDEWPIEERKEKIQRKVAVRWPFTRSRH